MAAVGKAKKKNQKVDVETPLDTPKYVGEPVCVCVALLYCCYGTTVGGAPLVKPKQINSRCLQNVF